LQPAAEGQNVEFFGYQLLTDRFSADAVRDGLPLIIGESHAILDRSAAA
jgi:hypothetical protein